MTRRLTWLLVGGAVLAACGGAPAADTPSLTAEAVVAVDDGPTSTPTPSPTPSPTPTTPSPTPTPTASVDDGRSSIDVAAPGPAIVAALVAREVDAAGQGAEHVVVDLDGDEVDEVVVAAPRDGVVRVRVWWWTSGVGFGDPVTAMAGPGREVRGIRVGELTGDGDREVVVGAGDGSRGSLAVWSVRDRSLRPQDAVGGCHDGSHVYGATGARFQERPGGPPAILATCDDIELPLRDRTTAVYEHRDGAYRFVPPPPPPAPDPPPSPSPDPSPSPEPSPSPDPSPSPGDGDADDDDEDDEDDEDDDDDGDDGR